MLSYAILIDAGFLKRKLGSQESPLTGSVVEGFIDQLRESDCLSQHHLHRIYFYDAPPLETRVRRPLGGGGLDFGRSDLSRVNKALHDELRHIPYVALRLGDLMFRGWQIGRDLLQNAPGPIQVSADDLKPNVQQKGVDMRIGLDIASLTLKRQVTGIVLVTGDSDFVPAMKFARREGAQLFLVTFGHAVRPELREHADVLIDIDPKAVRAQS